MEMVYQTEVTANDICFICTFITSISILYYVNFHTIRLGSNFIFYYINLEYLGLESFDLRHHLTSQEF
jgi:hypothetical protein